MRNNFGVAKWVAPHKDAGSSYKGYYKDGMIHGKGTYVYSDG